MSDNSNETDAFNISGEINVRQATVADLDFVRGDERAAITGIAHEPDKSIIHKITRQEVLIAEHKQQRMGYLYFDYPATSIPYIRLIWVLEAHRRQGVGKSLLHYLETMLRDNGLAKIYSSSSADEVPPQEWHRHMGFNVCDSVPGVSKDEGEIFLVKRLD